MSAEPMKSLNYTAHPHTSSTKSATLSERSEGGEAVEPLLATAGRRGGGSATGSLVPFSHPSPHTFATWVSRSSAVAPFGHVRLAGHAR